MTRNCCLTSEVADGIVVRYFGDRSFSLPCWQIVSAVFERRNQRGFFCGKPNTRLHHRICESRRHGCVSAFGGESICLERNKYVVEPLHGTRITR